MRDAPPIPPDGRARAALAMAAQPDDERTRVLVTLRRARGTTAGPLPLTLDLRRRETLAASALGGWSFAGSEGSWTDGFVA